MNVFSPLRSSRPAPSFTRFPPPEMTFAIERVAPEPTFSVSVAPEAISMPSEALISLCLASVQVESAVTCSTLAPQGAAAQTSVRQASAIARPLGLAAVMHLFMVLLLQLLLT